MEGFIFLIIVLMIILINYLYIRFLSQRKLFKKRDFDWKDIALLKMRLQLMTPREFEVFVCELFSLQGYDAIVTKATGDGGKDVIVYNKDGTEIFIECKLYDKEKDSTVSRPIAMKLMGAIAEEEKLTGKKVKGMIFSTARFTKECEEYCKFMGIKMIDINGILNLAQEIGTDGVLLAANITPSNVFENDLEEEKEQLASETI